MYKASTQAGELLFIAPLNHLQTILGLHTSALGRINYEITKTGSCDLHGLRRSPWGSMIIVVTKA